MKQVNFFKVYARGIHNRLLRHIPKRIRTSTWPMLLVVFPYSFCELLFCSSWFVVMVVHFLCSLNISSRVLCQGIKFYSTRTILFQQMFRYIALPTFGSTDNWLFDGSIVLSLQIVLPRQSVQNRNNIAPVHWCSLPRFQIKV